MPYLVAISGASGSIYSFRLIEELNKRQVEMGLIVTDPAIKVIKDELGFSLEKDNIIESLKQNIDLKHVDLIRAYSNDDIYQPPASGSNNSDGMVVIPASMASVAAIAAGLANNLLTRAADVHLKQDWPLLLVPRETPLNKIHLQNMLRLAEAGASIIPAMPGFYYQPKKIDDLVNFIVGKVLEKLGFKHDLYKGWKEGNIEA